ncbi:hypothetical protein CONCODRAFT_70898 [Conidiobolus coronatus NRRL 28638]|uniref:ABC transporter domain-containing protein n=1 Tax=Conidiobolus coronatus (strain ATCC 28846 / CBS 209.66 / NRRL 28638) TaxID=796925 RepID=A0A137P512_CONC2|nr:hypothetical protein CONCODRAFT_70898 [Conidiobolus coronatus NRRL 28638]|eukprot:KXN70096.1 hypothetical protein CONCODRAFT_70898 [Conidiobolus coronatus NRRL 28638]
MGSASAPKAKKGAKAKAGKTSKPDSKSTSETLVTLSNEIDLKDVSITIGDKIVLEHSHLRIKTGTKYGLVGSNGVGKSTLLRVITDYRSGMRGKNARAAALDAEKKYS